MHDRPVTRGTLLKGAGALGVTALTAPLLGPGSALGRRPGTRRSARPMGPTPIEHIIIDCQENRSFDHYFGFAPFAGPYGVPPGYTQPDGQGGTVAPFEFTSLT